VDLTNTLHSIPQNCCHLLAAHHTTHHHVAEMFSLCVASVDVDLFLRAVNLILMRILVLSVEILPLCHILDVFAMSHHTIQSTMNLRKMFLLSPVPQHTLVNTADRLIFLLSTKVFGSTQNESLTIEPQSIAFLRSFCLR
jgi:hypothetical protein